MKMMKLVIFFLMVIFILVSGSVFVVEMSLLGNGDVNVVVLVGQVVFDVK